MRRTSLQNLRSCRPYFFRNSSGSSLSTTAKPLPLRIFAVVPDAGESQSWEAIQARKEKKYQEWLENRIAQSPSDVRLNDEFKRRMGFNRPKGLLAAAKPKVNREKTKMLSRMDPASVDTSKDRIAPSDLLQPSESLDTDESIFAAIHGCLTAAVERLELSQNNTEAPQPPSLPPKEKLSIPHDQFVWLCNILQFQFTKSQLIHYGHKSGLTKSHLLKEKTLDAIKMILEKVWNLEKEPELPAGEALVTKNIPVSRRELFFMIGEDGGGTLWRWVYHCQARIIADLNKPVLKVTATPANLKKLEWVIRQMFKDSEDVKLDLSMLRALGKFDASYFLPVIARLSSTYIDVNPDSKDELGLVALGISALGKKRHRVEFARQLVVGSMVATYEAQKDILYSAEDTHKSALFQVLDPSLPWWTEKNAWTRWAGMSSSNRVSKPASDLPIALNYLPLHVASSNRQIQSPEGQSNTSLSRVIESLTTAPETTSAKHSSRILALPGHILHNTDKSGWESKLLTAMDLMKMATQSAGDISPPQIFSPHNINSRAILQSCHAKKNEHSNFRHVYTMSFIASPWDFAETFSRIPQLVLRVSVDPTSWEAVDLDARLSFGYKYTDIMLPSLECDLRLQREDYMQIPSADSIESFTQYLNETRLDPSRNRRLTANSFLELDIESEGAPGSSVKYFLTRMDFRKELSRTFLNHEIVYADIDGGDAWGRQKQISMVISDNGDGNTVEATTTAIEEMISKAGL